MVLGSDWLVSVMMVLVCLPSDPSLSTYCLTWVSLTSDTGYLFTAAPAKHSRCPLPWMRGISSLLPLLTLDMGYLLSASYTLIAGQINFPILLVVTTRNLPTKLRILSDVVLCVVLMLCSI